MDKSSPNSDWTLLPSYTIDYLLQTSEKYRQSHVEQNEAETPNEIEMMSQQSSDSRMEADSQESVGSRMEFSSQESDGSKMDLNLKDENLVHNVVMMQKTNKEIREKLENLRKELRMELKFGVPRFSDPNFTKICSLGKRKYDSIQLGFNERVKRAKILVQRAFELQEMAILARDKAVAMQEAVISPKKTSDQKNP